MRIWYKQRVKFTGSWCARCARHIPNQLVKRPASCNCCVSPKMLLLVQRETLLAGTFSLVRLKKRLFTGMNSSDVSEGVLPRTFKRVRTDMWGFFLLKGRQIGGRSGVVLVSLSWSSSKLRWRYFEGRSFAGRVLQPSAKEAVKAT